MTHEIHLGQRVMVVRNHWLRPMDTGVVTDFDRKRNNPWLVTFDVIFSGGGFAIDKAGKSQGLWLSSADLLPLEDAGWFPGKIKEKNDVVLI